MIVTVGDLMVDVFSDADGVRAHPGGKAGNYAAVLTAQGVRGVPVGAVGDDEDGALVVSTLKRVGVDTSSILVQSDRATGRDFIEDGEWQMQRGANWAVSVEHVAQSLERLIARGAATVLVNQGISGAAGEKAIELARAAGCFVVLNLGPEAVEAARAVRRERYEDADLIVVNAIELEHLRVELALTAESQDIIGLARDLFAAVRPRRALMVSLGPGGAIAVVRDGNGSVVVDSRVEPPPRPGLEFYIGAGDAMLATVVGQLHSRTAPGADRFDPSALRSIFSAATRVAVSSLGYRGTMTIAYADPEGLAECVSAVGDTR